MSKKKQEREIYVIYQYFITLGEDVFVVLGLYVFQGLFNLSEYNISNKGLANTGSRFCKCVMYLFYLCTMCLQCYLLSFPFFFFIPFDYDYFSSIISYFVLCFKTEPNLGRIALVTYHSTNKYTCYYTSLFLRLPHS